MQLQTALDCYQYVQNRLNRNSSNSGDNIPAYQFVEAFNTAQSLWVEDRAKLSETNIIRKDEIQQLLQSLYLTGTSDGNTYSVDLPEDYLHYSRSTSEAPCVINNRLVKEGDINMKLNDDFWKPSLDWGETLCTLNNNTLKIYTDGFNISKVFLVYYRQPIQIGINDGFLDVNGNPRVDQNPEFTQTSLIEILNLTCAILAGDSSDQWNFQVSSQFSQKHT